MSEEQKKQLNQQLWNIANTLRGKMDADEFRDYILGFIFYKYLSEKMELYANTILKEDKISYADISETTTQGQEYLEAIKEESLEKLGYFLKPTELFKQVAKRGNGTGKSESNFIIEDIQNILISIQNTTMGTNSEEDFDHLFEDMDLNSTKLGKTAEQRNEVIAKVLSHLDKIDFQLEQSKIDVLGDAYEYLIGQFASGAGKKAGEFYTPQQASKILARIVTLGKTRIKSAYDPTCGSGSLILRLGKVCDVLKFYGQERNRTTYNLCRMNMILHGIHHTRFNIKLEDTLEHPQHEKLDAEAVVANPPFSAQWSANPLFMTDDRFSEYGKLAPSSKADFAFIQHMIYHLAENGVMAVVMPHGILFRGAAEGHIRKYLIEEKNYLDAVIGLPPNIFYGTGIPTCILVFKKCREHPDNILFIDASKDFEMVKTQNYLNDEDVDRIVDTFSQRINIDKFSNVASLDKVRENDYCLNITRYVDTFEEKEAIDINFICESLEMIRQKSIKNDEILANICKGIGVPFPNGNNIFLLQQYKKWLSQKIFTQEIKFKDDNGKDFPKWEKKKLGEIAEKKYNKNKANLVNNVFTNSATLGIVNQRDFFDKDIANQNNLFSYHIVDIDDFIYNPRISNSAPVGPISRNHIGLGVMSPLYTVFTIKQGVLDFFEKYFLTTQWYWYMESIANYGARSDRMNITTSDFFKMPLPFPCIAEQSKIANLLILIDNKISLTQMQVENALSLKVL